MLRYLSFGMGLFICVAASSQSCIATLGESVDSIDADRKALLAIRRTTQKNQGYSIHEFEQDGTKIREYVSDAGVVFAIAWNGLTHPDLNQLLGSYFQEYEKTAKLRPKEPGRRRSASVRGPRVVVETWGHMRNLQGKAYVASLMPTGVAFNAIK